MIPVTALIAVVVTAQRSGRAGLVLAGVIALAFLAISLDVDLSPRLQRGNWRDVARALRGAAPRPRDHDRRAGRGAAGVLPAGLHNLARGASVTVSEIDETGYAPLRRSAGRPPAPGFRLLDRLDIDGLIVYRFVSSVAAHGLRGDAAPPRDHARAPRGARPGVRASASSPTPVSSSIKKI